MSYQNFIKAMKEACKCKYYTITEGKTENEIKKAEDLLGIKFSRQCNEFYAKYGYLSFSGNEIFGIDPDDDSGILEGNSVAYTLNDRIAYNLPKEWIPIYNFEDGMMAYLDYSTLNEAEEPRVIMAFYNGLNYEIDRILAEDLGDFILDLVKKSL